MFNCIQMNNNLSYFNIFYYLRTKLIIKLKRNIMKKILLTLFLGFTLFGFSQTTLIPDPNFEQALIDLGYDSPPINGSVPTANISGVQTLEVSDKSITDLTGIEGFNSLTILNCYDNELTSLDVTNNTLLTILNCYDNELTSLDVTNNTLLTILHCYDNELTSLDVTNNPALIELWCIYNQLTSLDVTNNPALIDFYCHDNELTSLDVSNNALLKVLNCAYNQLTSLDVRNGNNSTITYFDSETNLDLTCIFVDDPAYSSANWPYIDPNSTFVANEEECSLVSVVVNTFELGISVYPNPTNNYLFIEGNKNSISVSIYNLLGKKVMSVKNTNRVDVRDLSNGVYTIRISDGVSQTDRKFIKN